MARILLILSRRTGRCLENARVEKALECSEHSGVQTELIFEFKEDGTRLGFRREFTGHLQDLQFQRRLILPADKL
jgi:hypothetical protein